MTCVGHYDIKRPNLQEVIKETNVYVLIAS